MKLTIDEYQGVALWNWNLTEAKRRMNGGQGPADSDSEESDAADEEEDVCGICRISFDGCCPDCKVPGDGCPLVFGECTHIFHKHCLSKWIETDSSKKQCPMDRLAWTTVLTVADRFVDNRDEFRLVPINERQ